MNAKYRRWIKRGNDPAKFLPRAERLRERHDKRFVIKLLKTKNEDQRSSRSQSLGKLLFQDPRA